MQAPRECPEPKGQLLGKLSAALKHADADGELPRRDSNPRPGD
jgi:hypothetical protein